MKQSFYIYNNGDLKRKDNTMEFTNKEGEGILIERISDIYVMSEMSFNTKFLNYVAHMGFRFIFSIITIFIQAVFIHGKAFWQDSCSCGR